MADFRIILSLPSNPTEYLTYKYSWSQNTYFIYNGLKKYYGDRVTYIPFTKVEEFPFRKNDIFVTFCMKMPNVEKIVMLSPANFITSKWKYGSYIKYGYNVHFMPPTNVFDEHIKKCSVFIAQTNDVCIEKWNNDDEDVREYKQWFVDNKINVKFLQHPIDKNYYGSMFRGKTFNEIKMMIYWGIMPKDASRLVETLKALGYQAGKHFDIFQSVPTSADSMRLLLDKYILMGHTSYTEGFPYLVNEFMTGGIMPFCTDDWWNGYGNDKLIWSYNPEKHDKNIQNIKFLFDKNNISEINKMRNDLWNKHFNRKDNTWDYYNSVVIDEINKLI